MDTIYFDFDGTLVDTWELVCQSIQDIGPRFGLPALTPELQEQLRQQGIKPMIQNIGFWKLLRIVYLVKRQMALKRTHIRPFPGIAEELRSLAGSGCHLRMITSNTRKIVKEVLATQGWEHIFVELVTDVGIFNKTKALRASIQRLPGPRSSHNIVVVGDETRDIEAAHALGLKSVAVLWGYQNAQSLERTHPTRVAYQVAGLNKLILEEVLRSS